jgi:hypothetical protein
LPLGGCIPTKVIRGYQGRRHAGTVLMCQSCSSAAGSEQKFIVVIVLIVMAVVALIAVMAQHK